MSDEFQLTPMPADVEFADLLEAVGPVSERHPE